MNLSQYTIAFFALFTTIGVGGGVCIDYTVGDNTRIKG